jgi:hypothetical protein
MVRGFLPNLIYRNSHSAEGGDAIILGRLRLRGKIAHPKT